MQKLRLTGFVDRAIAICEKARWSTIDLRDETKQALLGLFDEMLNDDSLPAVPSTIVAAAGECGYGVAQVASGGSVCYVLYPARLVCSSPYAAIRSIARAVDGQITASSLSIADEYRGLVCRRITCASGTFSVKALPLSRGTVRDQSNKMEKLTASNNELQQCLDAALRRYGRLYAILRESDNDEDTARLVRACVAGWANDEPQGAGRVVVDTLSEEALHAFAVIWLQDNEHEELAAAYAEDSDTCTAAALVRALWQRIYGSDGAAKPEPSLTELEQRVLGMLPDSPEAKEAFQRYAAVANRLQAEQDFV